MNKQQLATLVWDSCNDLRGSISAVEYKDVILGLIFYRFLSEREVTELKKQDWTEEAMAEELNEQDTETISWCQERLGCFIAYENLFSTWMKNVESSFSVADVTKALNAFVRNIDSRPDHQKLYRDIFKSLLEKLTKIGSISEQTSHLKKVIKIVNYIPMDEHRGYDVLGFIYEFLLKNFASNSKKDGEFYTPHEISVLMSEIIAHHLQDREQISILDPTSGSGSLLINIGQSVQKYLQNSANITYYAQELIQETFNLTRMNLVMRGIKPFNIRVRRGDTLGKDWPYFDDNDESRYDHTLVDCVASNPPYSHKWNADFYVNDPRYRYYGTAPATKADFAFLLHELYHLKDNGIMCIVMPHGVLFRGGTEKDIRRNLILQNNIETIIGMPTNCFFGTGISTIIMVLKKQREASDVLMVDASGEFYKDGNKNRLSGHHIKKIVDAVLARQDIPHFASLVSRDRIIENEYNLNIPRYVKPAAAVPIDLHATVFGGVPNYEIDQLESYWEAFPSLREEIFARQDEHTSAVCCASARDAIHQDRDVAAFEAAYKSTFQQLEDELCSLLLEGPIENVHSLKVRITDKIFDLCRQFPGVDKYLVYQAFDEQWEQISVDLEAIRLQGLDAARSVEDVIEYDKKEQKAVKKGEEGRIIPFSLIQKRMLSEDFQKMDALEKELEAVAADYGSFWDELDEELKDELKKQDEGEDEPGEARPDPKRLKERYQQIIASLSNETTDKYDGYLALRPKQKLAYQQEHRELVWPEETQKNANGTYKQPAIKAIVEAIKNELPLPEEEDEYKVRYLYLLGQRIDTLRKQIKKMKIWLDEQARKAIASLTDEQIKALLREKWLAPVMGSINDIPASIENELTRRVKEIVQKYQDPMAALDLGIAETEKSLAGLLGGLTGGAFDMAAIAEMRRHLGGE